VCFRGVTDEWPLSRSKMKLREFEARLIALLKEAEKSGLDAEAIYRIADSVLTEWRIADSVLTEWNES
jgi:hypothetical protein